MTSFDATSKQPSIMNEGADFWFYEIGANILSSNTITKTTLENWR